jgi:4-diphosphocytidyl-2-C-methyl-D-erythritol kinase
MSIREPARAKVNLTLRVRGRLGDGYHALESLVTFARAHDVVTLEPGCAEEVVVTGPFATSIEGENLLARTLALLRAADPGLQLGTVRLEKRLPVAAGVGGGSSDAAALLRAARRANPDREHGVPWLQIADRLGADVPVCFADRPALVWGRGEIIVPVASLPALDAVLVNPGLPLATGRVFSALQAGQAPSGLAPPHAPSFAGTRDLLDYMRGRGNDLEPAAVRLLPAIAEIKGLLGAQADCRFVAMSGSGPTCFAVFPTPDCARRAAAAVSKARPGWWIECTVLEGTSSKEAAP